ncbi:MAG: acetylxylan esterase [Verrucomicrobia bacterium]|nr:acetylxylan esterase [Verrucomicrobiota bacterium]
MGLVVATLAHVVFGAEPAAGSAGPYREPFADSFPIRREQHLQITGYVDRLLAEQADRALRQFAPDTSNVAAYEKSLAPYRAKVGAFYGTPPPGARTGRITRWVHVATDPDCEIYRAWIEVIDGVEAYGLYLLPQRRKGRVPLLIAQHGGGGNPEAICDLDTRINYRSFGREAVRRGYAVWAPALAMRSSFSGDPAIPGAARELLDQKLRLAGTSIIGLELHKILESMRTLVRERPEIDGERIGMTGLSWGGFFTMYAAALEPRIKVAAPSGYLRDLAQLHLRAAADDSKVTDREAVGGLGHFQAIGLICPRPCLMQIGRQDGAINPLDGAQVEADRAAEFYRRLGIGDRFVYHLHAGGHEFEVPAILEFFDRHL